VVVLFDNINFQKSWN